MGTLLDAAVKELIGYGALGVLLVLVTYVLYRKDRQLRELYERTLKKKDSRSSNESKLTQHLLELANLLLEIAGRNEQIADKLLKAHRAAQEEWEDE
jgi:hypothetical protein